jgi:hypothetical protein
LSWKNP